MNQEPSQAEPEATSPSPRPHTSGIPRWLPYFALAVVPAVIVGLAVYASNGGGTSDGGGGNAAGIVDGFLRLGGDSSGGTIESFRGKTPPDFPKDIAAYPGAQPVVSFLIKSTDGTNYFVILGTSDTPDKVVAFYQQKLDAAPWQVEIGRSSADFDGIRFSRPDNADVQGDVSVHRSDLDARTSIFLSYQDVSKTGASNVPDKPFVLGKSRDLPPGFPSDMPIYKGKGESTVISTYYERGAGSTNFLVSFLTKDSQDDIVAFYRKEFQTRRWTVTDSKPTRSSSFVLGIDFTDGPKQLIQGSVNTDSFQDDADYRRVDLRLQVSSSRGRGN